MPFYMVTSNVGETHLPHIFVIHHVTNSWSSIVINIQRYLTALLISTSVMINGSAHFFKCLFAIPLILFGKVSFFVPFSNWTTTLRTIEFSEFWMSFLYQI